MNTLTHFQLIKVEGPDARKFLHSQLTCDVENLKENKSTWGAYCNGKGRVTSLFYLTCQNDAFYLFLPRGIAEHTHKKLNKYGMFSKVTITQALDPLYAYPNLKTQPLPQDGFACSLSINADCTYTITDFPFQSKAEEENVFFYTLLSNGISWLSPGSQALFLPQEINLDRLGGVSFQKGCYLGQEIVARIHFLGKLKKQLIWATAEQALNAGQDIQSEGKTIGQVVCAVRAQDQYHALAVVPLTCNTDGLSTENGPLNWVKSFRSPQ